MQDRIDQKQIKDQMNDPMKQQLNHGNRLRPPDEAYEVKKQRAKDRYADLQLRANPFWRHNKILRDLYNLYGDDQEINKEEFFARGFDFEVYKESKMINGLRVFLYDKHGFYFTKNKTICIRKI